MGLSKKIALQGKTKQNKKKDIFGANQSLHIKSCKLWMVLGEFKGGRLIIKLANPSMPLGC